MASIVRPAADDDAGALARIYGHHVLHSTATFEIEPPSVEEMAGRRARAATLGLPYLVALHGDEVVGYAYASAYRPRPAYRYTVEDSVYIAPEQVGNGYGTLLLQHLIEHCERGPWRQMVAVIGDGENRASVRLHERLGFRRVGVLNLVGFKFGRWVDVVLMQRALGPGGDEPPPV
jgi:phosphinothricin acetyltransferase